MSSDSLMALRRYVAIAHHIPGRIRLRFNNKLIASLGKTKLSALDDYCGPERSLYGYSLNAMTGSLLLEYDANRLSPKLIAQLFGDDDEQAELALTELLPLILPSAAEE